MMSRAIAPLPALGLHPEAVTAAARAIRAKDAELNAELPGLAVYERAVVRWVTATVETLLGPDAEHHALCGHSDTSRRFLQLLAAEEARS